VIYDNFKEFDFREHIMDELEKLKEILWEKGASLIGFSDISSIPENKGYIGAITIGYKLLDEYFDQINTNKGPTFEYFHHYRDVNTALDQMALFTATYLDRLGYKSMTIPASQSSNTDPYKAAFPHKSAALLAGFGWIGKSGIFISDKFGGRVRFATVLTMMPLKAELPISENKCGNCMLCFNACPAGAIVGKNYVIGDPRESIFDAEKCSTYMKKNYQSVGRGSVCGQCIAICPKYKGSN